MRAVNRKKMLSVKWESVEVETVPIVSATGLEIRAVDRLVRFVRNNPNAAKYSERNDPWRGKPVHLL
jgi:hypothetical protein